MKKLAKYDLFSVRQGARLRTGAEMTSGTWATWIWTSN